MEPSLQEQYYAHQLAEAQKLKAERPWLIAAYIAAIIFPYFAVGMAIAFLFRGRFVHALMLLVLSFIIGFPVACTLGMGLLGTSGL